MPRLWPVFGHFWAADSAPMDPMAMRAVTCHQGNLAVPTRVQVGSADAAALHLEQELALCRNQYWKIYGLRLKTFWVRMSRKL